MAINIFVVHIGHPSASLNLPKFDNFSKDCGNIYMNPFVRKKSNVVKEQTYNRG